MARARDSRGRFISGGGVTWDVNTLSPNLKRLPFQVDNIIAETMRFHAPRAESYAKTHASWTDRTGNARNGLGARPFREGLTTHGIVVYHSVAYGIWLEVRWSGRYAIIMPTVLSEGREVMKTLEGILEKVGS